jgi:hypothetical protein
LDEELGGEEDEEGDAVDPGYLAEYHSESIWLRVRRCFVNDSDMYMCDAGLDEVNGSRGFRWLLLSAL